MYLDTFCLPFFVWQQQQPGLASFPCGHPWPLSSAAAAFIKRSGSGCYFLGSLRLRRTLSFSDQDLLRSWHLCNKYCSNSHQVVLPFDAIRIVVVVVFKTFQPKNLVTTFSKCWVLPFFPFFFQFHCQFCSGSLKWICGHFCLWSCQNFANYNAYMSIYSIFII